MAAPYRLFMKILLIIFFLSSLITQLALASGRADGVDGRNLPRVKTSPRKVLEVNALLDYDEVCANPRHDPRKKGCNKLNP